MRLEILGAFILLFTALLISLNRHSISPGTAGLSLSYALQVTQQLMFLIRQSVEAENNMNSVERAKFYSVEISQEAPHDIPLRDENVEKSWPHQGKIVLQDLQMRYRPHLPLVLKGINVQIEPRERVGIVGRLVQREETVNGILRSYTRLHCSISFILTCPRVFFFVCLSPFFSFHGFLSVYL